MSGSISKVCVTCGSRAVTCDALAQWDETKQEWVIAGLLDNTDCEDCGGETSIEDVPLLPAVVE